MLLLDTPADWLAPHGLVVGYIRVTTSDVSFRSPAHGADHDFVYAIERVTGAVSEVPAVRIVLDTGACVLLLTRDPPTVARVIAQARSARERRTIYR